MHIESLPEADPKEKKTVSRAALLVAVGYVLPKFHGLVAHRKLWIFEWRLSFLLTEDEVGYGSWIMFAVVDCSKVKIKALRN